MNASVCLQAIPGFSRAKIDTLLARGITGETYRVVKQGQPFVLKIRSANAALFVPDGCAEYRLSGLAHAAGLAPEPVFCNGDGSVLLRRYEMGEVWSESRLFGHGAAVLGDCMARLHAIPVEAGSRDWAEQILVRYSDRVSASTDAPLAAGQIALADISRFPSVAAGLCHGDLVCSNVIEHNGVVRFIDWEYARVADPYFDLAVILGHYRLDSTAARSLLGAYSDAAGGLVEARLAAWIRYYDALQTLWLLVLAQTDQIDLAQQKRLQALLSGG